MLLARGVVAPDFIVTDFDGIKYELAENLGKGIVLNFWASWCGPCRWEMPFFEEKWREHQDNLSFVGIAVRDFEDEARLFTNITGVTYPNALDKNGEIAAKYNVGSMPTTYFIDKDGFIVRGLIGATNEGTLEWFIENLFQDE
jgi:thiol-disulfide isomerase/thioredoxin